MLRLDSTLVSAASPHVADHTVVDCLKVESPVWATARKYGTRWHCGMPHVVAAGQKKDQDAGQACHLIPALKQNGVPGAWGSEGTFHTLHRWSEHQSPWEAIPESGAFRGGRRQSLGPVRKVSNMLMTKYYETGLLGFVYTLFGFTITERAPSKLMLEY